MVPLVLPLSVLLASIMTFGSFSENYEFAAMKASGISLSRAMKGLTIFIIGLSIVAFIFANNVIPQAQYEFTNLRRSILQRKPAMAIAEGQFNSIGPNFNIKVDKKAGENGEKLEGVTIHKRAANPINTTIIRAKRGLLNSSESSNLLKLELFDGYYYEDVKANKPEDAEKMPFAKSSFSKQIMNIDLTELNPTEDNDDKITTNTMLTVGQLNFTIDSLENNYVKDATTTADNLALRTNVVLAPMPKEVGVPATPAAAKGDGNVPANLLGLIKNSAEKEKVLQTALNNVTSGDFSIKSGKMELEGKIKNINSHWLALYDKFVIAYACLLMFFIGAPLGAIIRKGGIGLPIVFAVLIFITFHFINTFGKKVAQENGMAPFMGAWLSAFVLTPLAVLFTYRATNDMGVSINFDWITVPFKRFFIKSTSETSLKQFVNLQMIEINANDEEWQQMQDMSNQSLINIVKNARQFNYKTTYRNKALKTLELRGILQEELLHNNNLYNKDYHQFEEAIKSYNLYTNTAVIAQLLSVPISAGADTKIILIPVAVITVVIFYISLFKSYQYLDFIKKFTGKAIGINMILALALGYPFYILIYFYNKSALKEALSQFNFNKSK